MAIVADAFAAYLRHLTAHIAQRRGTEPPRDKSVGTVRPLPSAARHWFDEAEGHKTFGCLADACAQNLAQEGDGKDQGTWASYLQKWLRRRGVYVCLLDGGDVDPGRTALQFEEDLRAPEQVTILALIEGAEFQTERMEFAGFQIVRPTHDALRLAHSAMNPSVLWTKRTTLGWIARSRSSVTAKEGESNGKRRDATSPA